MGKESVFCSNLFSSGMWFVDDLFENGKLAMFETWKHRGASETDRMIWCGVVRCVREKWIFDSICREQHDMLFQLPTGMNLESFFINIEKVIQKHIKMLLAEQKLNSLLANDYKYRIKHESVHGLLLSDEWKNIFLIPRTLPVDNKTKDLQYKIIMRFIPTNYLLHKMGKVNSQVCSFCNMEPETIEHLFFNCIYVKNIWLYVFQEWLSLTGSCHIPDLRSCVLGVNNEVEDSRALNTIMLLVKSFIMNCKYDKCVLSTASLARIFKQKVTLLSRVFDQDVLVQLAMMF